MLEVSLASSLKLMHCCSRLEGSVAVLHEIGLCPRQKFYMPMFGIRITLGKAKTEPEEMLATYIHVYFCILIIILYFYFYLIYINKDNLKRSNALN